MGQLFYGSACDPIVVPDTLLAHLQLVTTTKLRRGECFTLSWRHSVDEPGGRSTVWVQPSIPLRWVFDAAEHPHLDTATLNQLAMSASSTAGLTIDLNVMQEEDDAHADLLLSA